MTEKEIKKEEKIRAKEAIVLKRVYNEIPKNLRENIISERLKNPDLIELLTIAINEPNIDEGKKEKYRIILNDPKVNEKIFVENPKIVKMVNEALERGIKKEIKKGNLRPRNDKNIKRYEEYRKNNPKGEDASPVEAKS